jgi:hypothetical protein
MMDEMSLWWWWIDELETVLAPSSCESQIDDCVVPYIL